MVAIQKKKQNILLKFFKNNYANKMIIQIKQN